MKPLAPLSVDFLRSQLLTNDKDLLAIVTRGPVDYVFAGRVNEHKLWLDQERFHELRALYVTTHNVERVRELARDLPRLAKALRRAATGWRDARGVVHRFALDNPELTADVMRAELAEAPTI